MSTGWNALPPAGAPASGAVLVVEDDLINRTLLIDHVQRMGRRVLVADRGPQALTLLQSESCDLVLLDLKLPEMDGSEILARIKESGETRHIPVIVVSGMNEVDTAARCISHGAEDYLTKPFNPLLLQARITASLEKKRLRDQEAAYLQQLLALQIDLDRRNRELVELNQRLVEAALTDPLTELHNRRWAMNELHRCWQSSSRHRWPMACFLIDVDHFKRVNDNFGHDVGDEVLKSVAERLRAAARQHEPVCRIGGEEFLVLCEEIDRSGAEICAERLRAGVSDRAISCFEKDHAVTVSIGVAVRDATISSPEQILKIADQAVYAAKQAGRNRVVVALTG